MSQLNQLKEAEKKASQLVADARKARVDRMKEAKAEADQIISAYRKELEASYQSSLSKNTGSSGAADSQLDQETSAAIAAMRKDFETNRKQVEKMLIDLVCNVHIEAPKARNM